MMASSYQLPEDAELFEQLQQLASERLKTLPEDVQLSMGDMAYGKKDLLSHVKEGDEIGREIIEMQMEFLQDLANGSLYVEE